MGDAFVAVRCPADGSVLMERGPGWRGPSRHKCPQCRQRWTVDEDGPWLVDKPDARLVS